MYLGNDRSFLLSISTMCLESPPSLAPFLAGSTTSRERIDSRGYPRGRVLNSREGGGLSGGTPPPARYRQTCRHVRLVVYLTASRFFLADFWSLPDIRQSYAARDIYTRESLGDPGERDHYSWDGSSGASRHNTAPSNPKLNAKSTMRMWEQFAMSGVMAGP